MYLEELYLRLVHEARHRVQTGAVSERGLARLCGMSQPHMHNVLKNIRKLSPAAADRLMKALDLSIPALLWRFPVGRESGARIVPLLRNRLGPGTGATMDSIGGHLPLPSDILSGITEPVAAKLAPDLVLPRAFFAGDLVLLDQNPALRCTPTESGVWAVAVDGGLRIRYARTTSGKLYIADESTVFDAAAWTHVPLHGRSILNYVKGRIAWVGREMDIAA